MKPKTHKTAKRGSGSSPAPCSAFRDWFNKSPWAGAGKDAGELAEAAWNAASECLENRLRATEMELGVADSINRERCEWIPASRPPAGRAVEVIVTSEKYALAQATWVNGDIADTLCIKPGFYYLGNGRAIPAYVEWWIPLPNPPNI